MLQQIYSQHLDTVEYSETRTTPFPSTPSITRASTAWHVSRWEGYYQSSLLLPFDYVYFSKLNAWSNDTTTPRAIDFNVTCSDRNTISSIPTV